MANTLLDDALIPIALDLLNQFGKDAVFTVEPDDIADTYDPTTGDVPDSVPTFVTTKISPPFPFRKELVDDDLILSTDLLTIIAASGLTFTPITAMEFTFDNQSYKIEAVTPFYSGEQIAAFQLRFRGLNVD